ncbi:DEKNAAC102245 [Brettanomyces naardenensis]|uniref:tRNA pseudouridine(55) synthase n=1 Tax=Brettanomyces naardenensis TaxID=13370 RepID=A0A448YKK5_BRENA|nr:DEKNAAC102245 [Brettanomyces naardenensis]
MTSRLCLDKVNKILSHAECFQSAMKDLENKRNSSGGKRRRKFRTNKLKMGHGGTLDPIASGILILGVGSGTKKLGEYTNGSTKIYESVALLGGSTTTGDSEGQLLMTTENDFITREMLERTREKFIGSLSQTPPIFSALKMNGKPLYEYAREGLPLPREIKPRTVQIYSLDLADDCLSTDHDYNFLKSEVCEDGSTLVDKLSNNPTLNDHKILFSEEYMQRAKEDPTLSVESEDARKVTDVKKYDSDDYRAPLLHFTSKVSSGTYIRSLISDFGRAMGSSAYMVSLVRRTQSDWELGKNCFELSDFEDYGEEVWGPVIQKVFEQGPAVDVRQELEEAGNAANVKKVKEDTKRAVETV